MKKQMSKAKPLEGGFMKFYKIYIPYTDTWGVAIKDHIIENKLKESEANNLAQYLNTQNYIDTSAHERAKEAIKIDFDFESIYALYPRKLGKKSGIEKLKKIIKTPEKYHLLLQAVQNYCDINAKTDEKFLLHFSTFVNRFEDFLPEQASPKQEKLSLDDINRLMV
jgi:hypothetical protein